LPTTLARNGLKDLYLFAVLVSNHVSEVVIAAYAAAGDTPLQAGVVRLYGVVVVLGGWVPGWARIGAAAHGDVPPE
jgi:hypothetical protein